MTLLEIIRKKKFATATVATPATDKPVLVPSVAKVATVAVATQESGKVLLPEDSKRKARRLKVLAMLDDQPNIHRAFVTDAESDPENVIVTIAIRDLYTFEMQILKDKYDAFTMLELIQKGAGQ